MYDNDNPEEVLSYLKMHLLNQSRFLPLPKPITLYLTKGKQGTSYGTFIRNITLEKRVKQDIIKYGYDKIIDRYKAYDPLIHSIEFPMHYAMEVNKMRGVIAQCNNIFMFFPEVLGFYSNNIEDYLGFEFVDVWNEIFIRIIFPCCELAFTSDNTKKFNSLLKNKVKYISYFASIFHEIGHRVGPWKVSPTFNKNLKINEFQLGILGELATDSILVQNLYDIEEIVVFIFLQRLFWFGRMGFNSNSLSANLNTDNDCWIGSFLWKKCVDMHCVSLNSQGLLEVNIIELPNIFISITKELTDLAYLLQQNDKDEHEDIINLWMRQKVEYNEKFGYVLPQDFKKILNKCCDIIYNINES